MPWPIRQDSLKQFATMPMIIPPGDGAAAGLQFQGTTGNFTLTSPLPLQPPAGAYIWLPAGRVPVGNLLQYSEDFSNAAWVVDGAVKTSTTTTDRLGAAHAITLTATAGSAVHRLYGSSVNFIIGTTYTFSVYVKANTVNLTQITAGFAAFGLGQYCNFDLSSGTVTASAGGTGRITLDGSGFYRLEFTVTATATAAATINICFIDSPTASRLPTFTATGTESVIICDAQCEIGAVAQEYTARTVTTGNLAGMVYATFSSTTAGTVWNHQYTGGIPKRYLSPVALAGITDLSWLTQTLSSDLTLLSLPYIGGSLGPNGVLKLRHLWEYTNSATTKTLSVIFGGQSVFVQSITTTTSLHAHSIVANRNSESYQISNNWLAAGTTNSAVTFIQRTIDTTANQNINFTGKIAAATDFIVLHYADVEINYSPGAIV